MDRAFLVAQMVKTLPAPGLYPWVGKIPWRRAGQLPPVFLLENPTDGGAWWIAVHRATKSWT